MSIVVLLTRDIHLKGSWLTELEAALIGLGAAVKILPLSEFSSADSKWGLLVNRVSDAAPPDDAKACLAAMRSAELQGVPVLNGIAPFCIGTSKILHYELFARAGLRTPPYILSRGSSSRGLPELAKTGQIRFPCLIKPNSAGFGKGIARQLSHLKRGTLWRGGTCAPLRSSVAALPP